MTNPESPAEQRVVAEQLARKYVAIEIEDDLVSMFRLGPQVSSAQREFVAATVAERMFDFVGEGSSGKKELYVAKLPSLENIVSHASRRQALVEEVGEEAYDFVQEGILEGVRPRTQMKWERATMNWHQKTVPQQANIIVGVFASTDTKVRDDFAQQELDSRAFFDRARKYAIKASRNYIEEGIASLLLNSSEEAKQALHGNEDQLQRLLDMNRDDVEYIADLNWLKNCVVYSMMSVGHHMQSRN